MSTGSFSSLLVLSRNIGLLKQYHEPGTNIHIPFCEGLLLIRTACYASVNALMDVELSHRDNIKLLAYILIYFIQGSLPWQAAKHQANVCTKKLSVNPTVLCNGLPIAFKNASNMPILLDSLNALIINISVAYSQTSVDNMMTLSFWVWAQPSDLPHHHYQLQVLTLHRWKLYPFRNVELEVSRGKDSLKNLLTSINYQFSQGTGFSQDLEQETLNNKM